MKELEQLAEYYTLNAVADAVGGPVNLAIIVAVGGYVTLRSVECVGKLTFKLIKKLAEPKPEVEEVESNEEPEVVAA
ncbi:MAG: hypothetical protein HUJ53_04410 [Holdemanella sp.]|nr:hypothetical protein [Holdemanella sp.]